MIDIGIQAPDFQLQDQTGATVRLADFAGKILVIYFYPKDDTPGCTREGIDFSNNKSAFDALNTVVLGVSKDSVTSHDAFCKKHDLAITLLSDPDHTMIAAYGAWREKKNYGKTYMGIARSTVLIGTDGVIRKIWANVKVDGHADAVLKAISGLHQ